MNLCPVPACVWVSYDASMTSQRPRFKRFIMEGLVTNCTFGGVRRRCTHFFSRSASRRTRSSTMKMLSPTCQDATHGCSQGLAETRSIIADPSHVASYHALAAQQQHDWSKDACRSCLCLRSYLARKQVFDCAQQASILQVLDIGDCVEHPSLLPLSLNPS